MSIYDRDPVAWRPCVANASRAGGQVRDPSLIPASRRAKVVFSRPYVQHDSNVRPGENSYVPATLHRQTTFAVESGSPGRKVHFGARIGRNSQREIEASIRVLGPVRAKSTATAVIGRARLVQPAVDQRSDARAPEARTRSLYPRDATI